uniref:Uncharacterized protein n=1 Tax=Amphimedon queenslandica TaxID=400682 RepID=A0A1X7TQV4_AMPQE
MPDPAYAYDGVCIKDYNAVLKSEVRLRMRLKAEEDVSLSEHLCSQLLQLPFLKEALNILYNGDEHIVYPPPPPPVAGDGRPPAPPPPLPPQELPIPVPKAGGPLVLSPGVAPVLPP